MNNKRILFTGGSGKAGRHVVQHLVENGYQVLNLDLEPLEQPGVDNLVADVTDSGQVFNAMSMYFGFDELESGKRVPRLDAVVHFAAIPRILLRPDAETFRINTFGVRTTL